VGEQFTVRLCYDNGEHKNVRRFVSAQEAGRAFQHYTTSVGAELGSTVRVIVIDRNDSIVREWKFGQGITFPRPDLPLRGMLTRGATCVIFATGTIARLADFADDRMQQAGSDHPGRRERLPSCLLAMRVLGWRASPGAPGMA
jgi:hypothetical protein